MKRFLLILPVSLFAAVALSGTGLWPTDSGTSTGITIGDTTYLPSGNRIVRNGNVVIYQEKGGSTFSTAPRREPLHFLQNRQGQVVGPLELQERSRPLPPPPNPRNDNTPSPVPPPVRAPSFSSLPKSPFLRPGPVAR